MTAANSYFISLGKAVADTGLLSRNLGLGQCVTDTHQQAVIHYFDPEVRYTRGQYTLYLFGDIRLSEDILSPHFRPEDLTLLRGNFVAVVCDHSDKKLHLYSGLTGVVPGYIIRDGDSVFITSQLAAFRHTEIFHRQLIPLQQYQYTYSDQTSQDFSLLQQTQRIIPGTLYTFDTSGHHAAIRQQALKVIGPGVCPAGKEDAKETLFRLLSAQAGQSPSPGTVAVALSGGVDSGTIAGLLAEKYDTLHSYTIGTGFGDEFADARKTARHCGSNHHELFIDEVAFAEGLIHSVFYNEIFDPVYAEGYVAYYHILKQATAVTDTVFTGYGADLILGNMFPPVDGSDLSAVNASWCRRTSWTGELSPYLAGSFHSKLLMPYWNEDMIGLGLSLPTEWLVSEKNNKLLLREMSLEQNLTLPNIAFNKKTALNRGTSLDLLFSKMTGSEHDTGYRLKSYILYYLFEEIFVLDRSIEEIDLHSIISKAKKYRDSHS